MTTLFDFAEPPACELLPMSHANDPITSTIAAANHVRSGKRDAHAKIVLELVTENPGCTSGELAEIFSTSTRWEAYRERHATLDLTEIRRRLTGLNIKARVYQGPARACKAKGSAQVTWFVMGA
jgi:hypothetical protein